MTTLRLFAGSYTSPLPHAPNAEGQGIYSLNLELDKGLLTAPQLAAEVAQPSFLAAHPHLPVLYAISELDEGQISAYGIQPDGSLKFLNQRSTQGASPAHVSVNAAGRYVLCTNYVSGLSVLAFPVSGDGSLEPCAASDTHHGHGPNLQRQESPHPHSVTPSPDGRHAYVADLGTDEVVGYDLDPQQLLKRVNVVHLPPGSGPRHTAFDPAGLFAFVTLELASGVAILRREPESGELALMDVCPVQPPNFSGTNAPAEVMVSPDGHFVYVSNRGHDSVAVFRFDTASVRLTLLQYAPTLGHTPRGCVLTPDGSLLLAGNQSSSNITVFRRQHDSGLLQVMGTFGCPTPTSFC
ncbi:lactonase family protein [Deinococcus detaillensis]|uniref:Lactonase family protein n=1 Tax=Deinococcus detaillensis TaxID=2592048 RepID=A0A553V5B3_9DEIO|nr:lactonase family protein [Deinococcus detaillensis]TSA87632.1 lactonase family protein [Deinococcus detaillensis]